MVFKARVTADNMVGKAGLLIGHKVSLAGKENCQPRVLSSFFWITLLTVLDLPKPFPTVSNYSLLKIL